MVRWDDDEKERGFVATGAGNHEKGELGGWGGDERRLETLQPVLSGIVPDTRVSNKDHLAFGHGAGGARHVAGMEHAREKSRGSSSRSFRANYYENDHRTPLDGSTLTIDSYVVQ